MDPEQEGVDPANAGCVPGEPGLGDAGSDYHTLSLATLEAKDLHCHFLFGFLEGKGKIVGSFY